MMFQCSTDQRTFLIRFSAEKNLSPDQLLTKITVLCSTLGLPSLLDKAPLNARWLLLVVAIFPQSVAGHFPHSLAVCNDSRIAVTMSSVEKPEIISPVTKCSVLKCWQHYYLMLQFKCVYYCTEANELTYHSVQGNRTPLWLWSTAHINHRRLRIL